MARIDLHRLRGIASSRRSIGIAETGLVLALAYIGANLAWTLAEPPAGMSRTGGAAQAAAYAAPDAGTDYRRLALIDPFHPALEAAAAPVNSAVVAPETTLALKLVGVRAGADSRAGSAIIQTPNKRQALFTIDDEIVPGARVLGIYNDRVEISRTGIRESLFLDPERARRQQPKITPVAPALHASRAPGAQASALAALPITELDADPEDIFRMLRFKPRLSGATVDGFFVEAAGAQAVFAQAGFRPGDVVLAVNGTQLTSIERAAELGQRLKSADRLTIELERGGEKRTLNVQLDD